MDLKYSKAIMAGIIGGIIVAFLILIRSGIDVIGSWTTSMISIIGCCIWIVEVVMLLATGVLAVHLARVALKDLNDSLLVGAVAGGIAGLIAAVTSVIVAFVSPFLMGTNYVGTDAESIASGVGFAGISSFTAGTISLCCCGPFWIVVSVFLGAVGGAIYYSVKK